MEMVWSFLYASFWFCAGYITCAVLCINKVKGGAR